MEENFQPDDGSSEETNLLRISNNVVKKLMCNGAQGKLTTVEDFWMNKLATLDQEHTKKQGLDIQEAERILDCISEATNLKAGRNFPINLTKVARCLRDNKGHTLICNQEVAEFKKSVDQALHNAVSTDMKDQRKKKGSYMEKFERTHQF